MQRNTNFDPDLPDPGTFDGPSARAVVRIARDGWLAVAVRLSWKPLLGALLCAALLGAAIDHFMPRVNSLPAAVRVLMGR